MPDHHHRRARAQAASHPRRDRKGAFPPLAKGRNKNRTTLVLAWGNPLRADDAVGPRVARSLAASMRRLGGTIITAHQLLPEHAEPIAKCRHVFFVDASLQLPPGQVTLTPIRPRRTPAPTTAHADDPRALLALARLLFGRAPPATLVCIGVAKISYSTRLSSQAAAGARQATQKILHQSSRALSKSAATSPHAASE